ncbi:MAG TPA: M20 family metallopeptidase [Bacteroidales bacterium]|nr:M20 family metallopeptidase [Bacteroidales bacterium]
MEIKLKIQQLAEGFFNEVSGIRQHIHRHPELSFQEFETSAYIQEQLRRAGIPFKTGFVKTGILGIIEGRKPARRVIALRAELDALPIEEQNNIPYKSEYTGRMHACGHDMHMASLLGAAKILQSLKDEFDGTVLLIFQPGEEKLPGGASLMLSEGVFNDLTPELIIGQHVLPGLESGKVGYRPGMYMASADEIYITVNGRGGHGATPHQVVDPVLIAAQIIVSLQQIVSRNANPAIPSVLSFGKLEAAGATNVIPPKVNIEGTFRTMHEPWRAEAHARITGLARSLAEGMGGTCEIRIVKGYPVLTNDEILTRKAAEYSAQLLGEDNVVNLDLRMTSDDFAWFSQKIPGVFYRFGIMDAAGKFNSPVHSPTFMADEGALKTAMSNLAWLAFEFLGEK